MRSLYSRLRRRFGPGISISERRSGVQKKLDGLHPRVEAHLPGVYGYMEGALQSGQTAATAVFKAASVSANRRARSTRPH